MATSPERNEPGINKITHKELQIIFNLSKSGAKKRLAIIRASVGKTVSQTLTVFDFCRVEDIPLSEFDLMILRASGGKKAG